MSRLFCFITVLFFIGGFISCKKQSLNEDATTLLSISEDTLRFDTVFTTVGSTTQYFTITNDNRQKLTINNIQLMGGNASAYNINIDGTAGVVQNNIAIDPGDSIYVFVSVTIDPSSDVLPFLVRDSILISVSGSTCFVQLEAYGQNAHFVRRQTIDTDTIWKNDLPYVVYDELNIAENSRLTIEQGCRIYLYADAAIIVDGTLQAMGTSSNPITFRGSRLDDIYSELPASWPGIYFRPNSRDNVLQFCRIQNAYQGVAAIGSSVTSSPKVLLTECIIDNIYDAGILAVNSYVEAINCLVSNCGSNIVIEAGGQYDFTYCTIVGYDSRFIPHKNSVLTIRNVDEDSRDYPLDVVFRNCILWSEGSNVENEVFMERKGNSWFKTVFDHVLYKATNLPTEIHTINVIANQDPLFDDINLSKSIFDFHIGRYASPAIGSGTATAIVHDLDGRPRTGSPDLGCYTKP